VVPFILIAIMFIAGVPPLAQAQTYTIIYNFTGEGSTGATPFSGPTLDQLGNFYGTTYTGGRYGSGSVYRLAPSGSAWR
jgi:uncharacterized repeat protein (TIGR03803 family)